MPVPLYALLSFLFFLKQSVLQSLQEIGRQVVLQELVRAHDCGAHTGSQDGLLRTRGTFVQQTRRCLDVP